MLFKKNCPIIVTDNPKNTNTVVNPNTKQIDDKKTDNKFFLLSNSSIDRPVTNVIYTGIRGKIQGLIKVNIPAKRLANIGKLPNSCIIKVLPQAFFVSEQLLYPQFL